MIMFGLGIVNSVWVHRKVETCVSASRRRQIDLSHALASLVRSSAAMETDYKVKLEIFEGPLDLLLYLIKRDEIDIYDISLERITRQYLEYLQAFKELNIDVAGEFIVMAANLIYLKSRSLLPVDQQPPEEDAEEDDPRWDLIRQLIEYKKFKEAAEQLQVRAARAGKRFSRGWQCAGSRTERAVASGRSRNFSIDQRVSNRAQTSRSARRFAGNFRREFYRLGQDRSDFAKRRQ